MNDTIVSVRMPSSLVSELKRCAKENHFLDVSEELRSIIRKRWLEYTSPKELEIKKLRENIEKEVKRKTLIKAQEDLIQELERMKKEVMSR